MYTQFLKRLSDQVKVNTVWLQVLVRSKKYCAMPCEILDLLYFGIIGGRTNRCIMHFAKKQLRSYVMIPSREVDEFSLCIVDPNKARSHDVFLPDRIRPGHFWLFPAKRLFSYTFMAV